MEGRIKATLLTNAADAPEVLAQCDFHPLIAAAAFAFKAHYPLTLSPDMLWLTILQGVAEHVNSQAESLRHRLVQHESKIELVVPTNLTGLPANDPQVEALISDFLRRLRVHLVPGKQFLLEPEFSTTTSVARVARGVAFMEIVKPYFDYVFSCICGIPSITLQGTSEDWAKVHLGVQSLHESDLDLTWWTAALLPLTDQFVRASRGDVVRCHWGNLIKITERYGVEDLNGWLLKFIPYVHPTKGSSMMTRNPVVGFDDYESPDGKAQPFRITGCFSDQLPSGLSRCPVTILNRATGDHSALEFVAGYVGVAQDLSDLALKPVLGWAISEGARIECLLRRLGLEHETRPPSPLDNLKVADRFGGNLPHDLARFYEVTDGAVVAMRGSNSAWEILPLAQVAMVETHAQFRVYSEGQSWSVNELAEQREFNRSYGNLVRLAACKDGGWIVFGRDPEVDLGTESVASRGEFFFWNGERHPTAFKPLARTFTQLLEDLLSEAALQ